MRIPKKTLATQALKLFSHYHKTIGVNNLAKCPKCGEEVKKPDKEWDYGPKRDPKRFQCQHFRCSKGHGFVVWNKSKK
jgi:hypothetical protein